ncbi:MAG: helix-turn-helix transcriptional regulator [Mycolicibacterium cosmeticum]|nr:helix-turn-helix transcriptional regulator [Mycolicibacterium cosmeticum]
MHRLGPKLRAVRTERGLTLEAVAKEAGLTKGFLSLVERDQTTVSVPNLLRICDILGVSVGSLFDFPDSTMVRSGQGAPMQMGGSGIREYLLTPATEKHVQVMRTILAPGGGSGGTYTLDADTTVAVVIRGSLRLVIDDLELVLGAGDCYTFSPQSAHSWENADPTECEVIWSIAPPLATTSSART